MKTNEIFNNWLDSGKFPKIFLTYTRKQQFKIFINNFFIKQ